MNLYEIDHDFLKLQQALEESDGELTTEIAQMLDENEVNVEKKYSNYVKMINMFSGKADMIDNEIARLTKLKNSQKSSAERLKTALADSLKLRMLDKYDGTFFKLSWRKSSSVEIEDESLLNKKYLRVVTSPNKTAIKNDIQAGKKVKGAYIKENTNLQIK